jgi:hypothetical protein
MLWFDTTNNLLKLYDGTNWNAINDFSNLNNSISDLNSQVNTLNSAFISNDPSSQAILRAVHVGSSAPSNPTKGTTWLDTSQSTPTLKVYNGSNWQTVSSSSSSSNRVDLSNATSDYSLSVGQEAIIKFSNTSSVPLHIAINSTTDVYWLYCSAGACSLNPNNTTYSNAFYWSDWGMNNGSGVGGLSQSSAFALGNPSGVGFIVAYIDIENAKTITQHSANFGGSSSYSIRHVACHWSNPVSWTSLGTLTFNQSSSGYVLVKRLN